MRQLGDLEEQFARGEFAPLREWLREQIYRHGSQYTGRAELLQTRHRLRPRSRARTCEYLRTKFA